jgi:hypothetical protein
VVEEKVENLMDGLRLNQMVVIEDENMRIWASGDPIDKCRQHTPGGRQSIRLEHPKRRLGDSGINSLQSRCQVSQETIRIVIALV